MVTHSPTASAADYPEPIARPAPEKASVDPSGNAPGKKAPDMATLQAQVKALEASNAKLTGDVSSANGRYQALRRDVENGGLSHQADSFAPALANGMIELAQVMDPEGKSGVKSRIEALVKESSVNAADQRQASRESGYEATMSELVTTHGLQENPVVKEAASLYKNAKTDAQLRDAVDMVRDAALDAAMKGASNALPFAEAPPATPAAPATPEAPAARVDINPDASNASGMPAEGQALMGMDIDNMSQDELKQHKKNLVTARKNGDFFPSNTYG